MYKQIFLSAVLVVACASATYALWTPNPKKQAEKAFSLLQEGNFNDADKVLNESKMSARQLYLFKSYVEQARERFSHSDQHLQTAYQEAKKAEDSPLLFEILLAKASNAYFEGKEEEFSTSLDQAERLVQHHGVDESAWQFFAGLQAYSTHHYAEALRLWNTLSSSCKSPWLSLSLDRLFPIMWKKMHLAHCLIETGELQRGRELLEKESCSIACSQEYQKLASLFLGLSYLKEARKVPADQWKSTYAMAHFYFGHGAVSASLFGREKDRLIEHLEEEANKLLLTQSEKTIWALNCIQRLQEWNAHAPLMRLAENSVKKIIKCDPSFSQAFCEQIALMLPQSFFHSQLTELLLVTFRETMKKGESSTYSFIWDLVLTLNPQLDLKTKELVSLTQEDLFNMIKKDSLQLTRTSHYLTFWEEQGQTKIERDCLARQLLYYSKLLWQSECQEKKGTGLMELALRLAHYPPALEKEVGIFLTSLFRQAESSNGIQRLTLIYEAMEYFNIMPQELVTKAVLANHLADSEYLYEVHNYPSAHLHASWVLKLDPENEAAHRLVGLCSFHLGEYDKALNHLQLLGELDEYAFKALMLSQALSVQGQTRQICQSDLSETFEDTE